NATFSGPTNIAVAPFNRACRNGGTCIPQPNTSQKLDSLGDRLMHRLAYRNLLSVGETLVVNHSVSVGGRKASQTGVRWDELSNPNGTPSVVQQGTFAPDAASRWMGSAAMDKVGDLAIGYSVSSSSIFPGIRIVGRLFTDPLNLLQAENNVFNGGGSQLPNL